MSAKRAMDVVGSATALIGLSPILVVVAAIVRLVLGRPVLFRQRRPGLGEKPFTIYKFRTMREVVDRSGECLPDGERLDPMGTFLRRTSIDELPEFWNVLRGDMSLVGPRPLLTKYLPYYSAEERVRFSVRPGVTGWAQVNGRNESAWDERLARDVWYVRHRSLGLDFRILWMTVAKVMRREQVVADARTVMLNLDEERGTAKGLS